MWFDCVLWMSLRYNIIFLIVYLVFVDEIEGKHGLTLGVMFHSIL